jgi:pyridinium-3,5-biscarboxylic acid mononucleotide synthase
MNQPEDLKQILQQVLQQVANGSLQPEIAFDRLQNLGFDSVEEFAKIDSYRHSRNGFPEVIWGAGKTPEQISKIMQVMLHQNERLKQSLPIMATRIEHNVFTQLKIAIPDLTYYPVAKIAAIIPQNLTPQNPGLINIITAGTSDIPVAEEAAITAELSGFQVKRLWDVGVAGIHRLFSNLQYLQEADVLIVVAGMEGALPSVVGGLAQCPVIAVPTSIGYGASFHGLSALLTMLNSCASGIGVMNIDNGFGAAILAVRILKRANKLTKNF